MKYTKYMKRAALVAMVLMVVMLVVPAAFAQGAEAAEGAGQSDHVGVGGRLRGSHRGVWLRLGSGAHRRGGLRRHRAESRSCGWRARRDDSGAGVR